MKKFNVFLLIAIAVVLNTAGSYAQGVCSKNAKSVYFQTNQSNLTAEHKKMIDEIIKSSKSEIYLEIKGHTDSVGSAEFNNKLSEKRAKAVADYIIANSKFNKKDIRVSFYGKNNPANVNDLSKNRRTDVIVVPLKGDKLVFQGAKGSSVAVPLASLGGKSVCDCNFTLSEITSDAEAEKNKVVLKNNKGELLTINGMVALNVNNCLQKDKNATVDVVVPISNRDLVSTVWLYDNNKWTEKKYAVTKDDKAYTVKVPVSEWTNGFIACAGVKEAEFTTNLVFPKLNRLKDMTLENQKVEGTTINDTTLTVTFANEDVVFNDVAQDDSIGVYRISKSIKGFRDAKKNVVFPLSAYEKLNYQDTMLLVRVKKNAEFKTKINEWDVKLSNAVYKQDRKFFFDKIFTRDQYLVNVPFKNHTFIVGDKEFKAEELKAKYIAKKKYKRVKLK
jgi:hypothetical protein